MIRLTDGGVPDHVAAHHLREETVPAAEVPRDQRWAAPCQARHGIERDVGMGVAGKEAAVSAEDGGPGGLDMPSHRPAGGTPRQVVRHRHAARLLTVFKSPGAGRRPAERRGHPHSRPWRPSRPSRARAGIRATLTPLAEPVCAMGTARRTSVEGPSRPGPCPWKPRRRTGGQECRGHHPGHCAD